MGENVRSSSILLSSAVISFAFRYSCNETGTDVVMKNNAMHVLFNNKEFHKIMKLIKIKIILFF